MTLPRIGGIIDSKACLKNGSCSRTAPSSHRGIDDPDPGELFLVDIEESIEGSRFATRRPPGKDLQFRKRKFNELARPFVLRFRRRIKVKPAGKWIVSGG